MAGVQSVNSPVHVESVCSDVPPTNEYTCAQQKVGGVTGLGSAAPTLCRLSPAVCPQLPNPALSLTL